MTEPIIIDAPEHFNNREISWLRFNKRVLEEAVDEQNPLLERLRFIGIFSNNLDEFFMVRVAGLKDQVRAGFNRPDNKSGLTALQQLEAITKEAHPLVEQQQDYYRTLKHQLAEENIHIGSIDKLSKKELKWLDTYFEQVIYPVLTPLAIDAYRPFPLLQNLSLNIAVTLHHPEDIEKKLTAIVQVPALLDRFVKIKNKHHYLLLEDVIRYYINRLFTGYTVEDTICFRITRNADMNLHEEGSRDLLKEIEKELKKRRWGVAVRLEIMGSKGEHNQHMINFLKYVLEVSNDDLYYHDGPLDFTFLLNVYGQLKQTFEHLVFQTLIPQPPKEVEPLVNIFDQLRRKDIMLHHPYESFEVIVDMIDQAATDPHVLAIKQTLYRVSGDSPIVNSLKLAAENGKQVTVLVELKARFDEENNVQWAKALEKAGCHVIYGITGLKTHSKITLIVRKDHERIERFVHLSTGNYNDQTAKFYTDLSILTSRREFGIDATLFFNFLSGYTFKPTFHHLSMAPYQIQAEFLHYIDEEIAYHEQHGDGHIIAKMNALTDKPLILKLYEASNKGVKIELIVRGICCLKPGIEGVSENITVTSIVGRFLEHSRIYYFHHHGEQKVFLASCDMMTRNMVKRIELLFPILDRRHKKRVIDVLHLQLHDNQKARYQLANGCYDYKQPTDEDMISSQLSFFDMAYQTSPTN